MTRIVVRFLAVFGLGVGACAPATPDWTAPDRTQAELVADWRECRDVAARRVAATGAFDPDGALATDPAYRDPLEPYDTQRAGAAFRDILGSCMRGKGYRPLDDGEPTPDDRGVGETAPPAVE